MMQKDKTETSYIYITLDVKNKNDNILKECLLDRPAEAPFIRLAIIKNKVVNAQLITKVSGDKMYGKSNFNNIKGKLDFLKIKYRTAPVGDDTTYEEENATPDGNPAKDIKINIVEFKQVPKYSYGIITKNTLERTNSTTE